MRSIEHQEHICWASSFAQSIYKKNAHELEETPSSLPAGTICPGSPASRPMNASGVVCVCEALRGETGNWDDTASTWLQNAAQQFSGASSQVAQLVLFLLAELSTMRDVCRRDVPSGRLCFSQAQQHPLILRALDVRTSKD